MFQYGVSGPGRVIGVAISSGVIVGDAGWDYKLGA